MNVLIVDDEMGLRRGIRRLLERQGVCDDQTLSDEARVAGAERCIIKGSSPAKIKAVLDEPTQSAPVPMKGLRSDVAKQLNENGREVMV